MHTTAIGVDTPAISGPATVVVQNGTVALRALVWRPKGRGPFPAVLFNHGSSTPNCAASENPHRLEIYPASGRTTEERHDFLSRGVSMWERDVFAFLDERVRIGRHR
jgi:hypothetical protein